MPPQGRYVSTVDAESGIRFVFKTDPADPEMLHIYARHLTSMQDAVDIFFEGDTNWNAQYQRYETVSETHALYWYWLEVDRVVMVVTCFRV